MLSFFFYGSTRNPLDIATEVALIVLRVFGEVLFGQALFGQVLEGNTEGRVAGRGDGGMTTGCGCNLSGESVGAVVPAGPPGENDLFTFQIDLR